jgi:hypothetical protein
VPEATDIADPEPKGNLCDDGRAGSPHGWRAKILENQVPALAFSAKPAHYRGP